MNRASGRVRFEPSFFRKRMSRCMLKAKYLYSAWLALLTGLLLVGGCDNSIEPYAETGSYSVYGYLKPSDNKQYVRVKPLTIPLTKVDSGSVNATVVLENLDEGTSETLKDSIIAFEDAETEVLTHNFWTETPIQYETRYAITVEGEAGSVQATTLTPTATDAEVTPQFGACGERFTVVFNEIKELRRVQATFEVMLEGVPAQFRRGDWAFFPLDRTFKTEEDFVAGTFQVESALWQVLGEVSSLPSLPSLPDSLHEDCWRPSPCAILGSDQVRVRYTYLGPEWYGDIPEDSLTYDPMESHDVTGGLGFFGSVREDWVSTTIDTSPFIWTGGITCPFDPPDSLSQGGRAKKALF